MADAQNSLRIRMAATGAAAGAVLWFLASAEAFPASETLHLLLTVLVWIASASVLLLTGPLSPARAALSALGLALAGTVLAALASLSELAPLDLSDRPLDWLAGFAVIFVPLPFVIAAQRPQGWADYPTLFAESWGIVVRALSALVFTGLVWALIALSDALLQIVGLEFLDALWSVEVLPWVVTGGILGLSLAVVTELSEVLSPALILRLLRLLVIPVLLVMALFLGALPVAGLSGLFGGASVTLTLVAMVAAAATLVTAALDRDDAAAAHGPTMRLATRVLALLLPLPALLAAYALWLRVDQYGWTPERLFVAAVAALGIGYGLTYATAAALRHHWMARIRRANIGMALALLALGALWLTPVMDAERIAARNQLARFEAGLTPVAALDLYALDDWGKPGAAARARLEEIAKAPGQEALAARLAEPASHADPTGEDPAIRKAQLDALFAVMPLQPPQATATRDILIAAVPTYDLSRWTGFCRNLTDDGRAGCVLAIADLWPAEPGEEAVFIARDSAGWVEAWGLGLQAGTPVLRPVFRMNGAPIDPDTGLALLRSLQDAPPVVSAAPLNRIGRGDPLTGIVVQP